MHTTKLTQKRKMSMNTEACIALYVTYLNIYGWEGVETYEEFLKSNLAVEGEPETEWPEEYLAYLREVVTERIQEKGA